jgi:hypothetical protein
MSAPVFIMDGGLSGLGTLITDQQYADAYGAPSGRVAENKTPAMLAYQGGQRDVASLIASFTNQGDASKGFTNSVAALTAADAARTRSRTFAVLGGGLLAVALIGGGIYAVSRLSKR